MGRTAASVAGAIALWLAFVSAARAHVGPPFPIIEHQKAGPYLVSVWTHPDVGTGTFYVILEAAPGTTLPAENHIEVCVQPKSGRLPERCYPAQRQDLRHQVQYYAEVEFDQQELWIVQVRINGPDGGGDLLSEVEPTPPGFGSWDLLFYGFPFVLFGLLWLCVALRRQRPRRSGPAAGTRSSSGGTACGELELANLSDRPPRGS